VRALFAFLGRHAAACMAGSAVIGLALPDLARLARPLLGPTLVVTITVALVRIDWTLMAGHARRPLMVAAVLAWLMLACPLIAWAALAPLGLPVPLYQAMVLAAASSPVLSNATFALILGLDAALAVVVVVAATALVPLTLPPIAFGLLGMTLSIDATTFMLRLAALVAGAFAMAWVIRRLAGPGRLARNATEIDGIAVFNLVLFMVAVMDGMSALVLARPGFVALAVAAAFGFNLVLQGLGAAVAWRAGARRALTIAILSGNCNMGLLIVALGDAADPALVAYFALAQIPMYTLPALLQPAYRALLSGRRAV
jgi:hypothetical protein